MTEYLKPSFSVALGSKAYRDNWDAIFGPKDCSKCMNSGRSGRYTYDYCDCRFGKELAEKEFPR